MKKLTTEEFIKKAKEVHGDKYDYSLVSYISTHINVAIICKEHGVFHQTPASHNFQNEGADCPICSGNVNFTQEDFIKKVQLNNSEQCDFSLSEFKNTTTKVLVINKKYNTKHLIMPKKLFDGVFCSLRNAINKEEYLIFQFKEKHGNKYIYSKLKYKSDEEKVIIICPEHGEFLQTPGSHKQGDGCLKCNSSKGEIKIINFLEKNITEYIHQHKFKNCIGLKRKLPFDFYLPKYNICIEYDGGQHFKSIKRYGGEKGFENRQKLDKIKTDYCLNNNIQLIRIPYWDFKNIEQILEKELNITCLKN